MIGLANNNVPWTPQALNQTIETEAGEVVAGIKLQRPRKGAQREEKPDYSRAIRDYRDEDGGRPWDTRDRQNYSRQKGEHPDVYYGAGGKNFAGAPGNQPTQYGEQFGANYYYEST